MPRPTPDYIPKEIVDKAAALGLTPKTYAAHIGLNPHRFYSFYGSKHENLKPYCSFADFTNVSLSDICKIAQNGEWREFINKVLLKHTFKSIAELSRASGVSESFIADRYHGKKKLNGLQIYIEMSEAQNITMDELRTLCGL